MDNLEQRIENKDTELQRTYYSTKENIIQLALEREKLIKRINLIDLENERLFEVINKCKRRAKQQGYPNLFK
jgi:hypothetical protein